MRNLIVLLVLFGVASIGLSQEPSPVPPNYTPRPSVALINDTLPAAQPPTAIFRVPVQASSRNATPAELRSVKIQHLLKAVEHLDAAGLHEDAQKIRGQADREKAAAVGDIKALQVEIERLRSLTQHTPQVLLKLRVVEISRTKLRRLGFDFSKVVPSKPGHIVAASVRHDDLGDAAATLIGDKVAPGGFGVLASNDPFFSYLDDALVKVLAEPTMVTVSNRSAHFKSGGEISVPILESNGSTRREFKEYGTSVDFLPVVLADQTIRLECRARVSELDYTKSVKCAGETIPGIRALTFDTAAELRPGQTLVLSGPVCRRTIKDQANASSTAESAEKPNKPSEAKETQEEVETLFLVTPEIVEPMLPANRASPSSNTAGKPAG